MDLTGTYTCARIVIRRCVIGVYIGVNKMSIKHMHEGGAADVLGYFDLPDYECEGHCVGYCDRPTTDDENAGSHGECVNCGEDLD